ncbi:MAG TPA: lecithin retinol acyltransferase family protein [Phycisphaerales bacterium]|nr:lecithin retinol acyltransferase family protein [Phycisphaerales bacterium]
MEQVCVTIPQTRSQAHHDLKADRGGTGVLGLGGKVMPPAETLYSAFKNNCEHFAYWCKTGQHYSPQANGLRQIVTVGTAVGVVALVVAALNDKN